MASIQVPNTTETEHNEIYQQFAETGKVDPAVPEHEEKFRKVPSTAGVDDYDDYHVRVCAAKRTLLIKHWLIIHPSLEIDLDRVIYILPAANAAKSGVTSWGVGATGVGWARDFHRVFSRSKSVENSYVCKYRDAWLGHRVGFTVEDPAKFLQTLEKLEPGITTRVHDEQVYHPEPPKAAEPERPTEEGQGTEIQVGE
ncbi:hypothetical protein DACRYDRAFT_19811 [Dacryopinax primogenitus]|uniref:Uncharacterized protein n=1 Tax=Dacryopinax primogenitus (strain DJM 731) TaxID=1858805 RepID=M5GEB0_DACPD|nr:uncharacterized protein DACRYDRAFT_19811 [Dacryopinax primogenitus]EJU05237.1 hypothetical protein DACRYDRAFT_19811 [Dacryopinax primogenitus]